MATGDMTKTNRVTAIARLTLSVFLVSLTLAAPVFAHHSPAGFDTTRSVTITGVVTKFDWFNPHVYITLEQTSADGKKEHWEIECVAPSMMRRIGWSKETLHVGDTLTISGSPSRKADSKALLAGSIKRADSTLMDIGALVKQFSEPKDAPKFVAKGIEGTWISQASMPLVVQESFPNETQLTVVGAQTFKLFDEKTMNPASNCIAYVSPNMMVMPDTKRITTGAGVIIIHAEFNDAQRTIHLNVATHDGAIPSHQGHSIGKWEGKTLVVDTTHFAYHASGNGIGLPSSPTKHLIERFTPNADGASLTYSYEMSDPEYLKAPRKGQARWAFRPDVKFAPEPCNLENARRYIQH